MKFEEVLKINVNDKTDKKNNLTYLSWAWAWGEFKKIYPGATYEIIKDNGIPYFADDSGAMVYTKVTANELTYEMWLPVMDSHNKSMKKESYTYKTKYGDKTVEAYTMFDVNKTIMRCLTKNLAMFGLGLYLYAGEDLPESETKETKADSRIEDTLLSKRNLIKIMLKNHKIDEVKFGDWLEVNYKTRDLDLIIELTISSPLFFCEIQRRRKTR